MRKNCGIIAGMSSEAIKKVIDSVTLRAFAEENHVDGATTNGSTESNEGGTTPVINYEDLIAKARKEEKEKQYNTIERLKGQVSTLTEQHNSDLIVKADLEKQLQDATDKLANAGKGDSEEVKTLKDTVETLKKDKADLEKKLADFTPVSREDIVSEVRAELEKEYEVKNYKVTKLAELKDEILVPELVFGSTKEEIDASIKSALERSSEIRKSLGVQNNKARTPNSPANPSVSKVQDTEVSLERLATMDVRSPEYAQLRQQLGLK